LKRRSITRRSKVLAGVIAGAVVLSGAAAASAAPPTDTTGGTKPDLNTAKKLYADGEKKYKAEDYAGALVDFRAANDIKSTPQAERYIGLSEDRLGHPQEALTWYDRFLIHVPDKLASQGDEIRKRETEIRALPGKVHIDSNPPGAIVTVDGAPQAGPTPLDVELAAGSHALHFTEEGRIPADRQVDVTFASAQSVSADLDPEPPPPPVVPPPPPVVEAPPPAPATLPVPPEPRSKVPAYVTGGLAVAAAAVGTVFGVMAINDKSDFDKNPTTSTADDGDTHALIADMAFGVALTFGVTSAVLFFTKDEQQQPAPLPATARADGHAQQGPSASGSGAHLAPSEQDAKRGGVTFTPTPWVGSHGGGAGFVLRF
jgi:PEGA domain